ncbi:MAG: vanadium-dependent haloperoxidase [Pseudomonadota bacterium]|nr:vanadium-dependent haloperoxidase [Pseudomonadota bacterium]
MARQWNEALLSAIRVDFARPTVHSRNLFHTSTAMYDSWAAYDKVAQPYLLGQTVNGYHCAFDGIAAQTDIQSSRRMTISYAAYRLLSHRFKSSPAAAASQARFDQLFSELGYDSGVTSTDYSNGSAAALGNHIAECLIGYGLQDGSNETNGYASVSYTPANPPLDPTLPGNPGILDLNRWQPLKLDSFIDQSGNLIPDAVPHFLGPEWGRVATFALTSAERQIYQRNGYDYWVYRDPGAPPYIDVTNGGAPSDEYKWNFVTVVTWSSHLTPSDGVMWDISPGAKGGNLGLPATLADYHSFYNQLEGGGSGTGHPINPYTGKPYAPNLVPRGDYTRVLAEFWADGPTSETPPGHWFSILNHVSDQPELKKRFRGQGAVVGNLEWDVKAYFALGGAMHDAAVSAWGIKGWYDYVRPISAIRAMAKNGQSSNPSQPSYSVAGLPLVPGYIELVYPSDRLAMVAGGNNIGKIKVKAWRGSHYVPDPTAYIAGVDWILAEEWVPYQRPSFVTPPFAGYVSGHSTFSRAAAEVLTRLTGDAYFPGGLGEFKAPKNDFLVFEAGPSVDITLQWATYRDAADQTSLSRIWGGIHPPADDIPGRLIGEQVGIAAFEHAEEYFIGLPN